MSYLLCLVLSYLISSCVLCTCSVFFFVMWCFGFSLSLFSAVFSVALLFFFAVFSSAFFAHCFLRCSVSSLFHFFFCPFCSFSALLWSLLSACLACFCLPDLSFSLFIFFFCACVCVCWIWFGYLLLNLFCFDIKL